MAQKDVLVKPCEPRYDEVYEQGVQWLNNLDKPACETEQQSWTCPNMKGVDNDNDMSGEHYECKVCGRRMFLDYEEMK